MKENAENKMRFPRPAIGESHLVSSGKVTLEYHVSGSGETVVLLPAFARAASDFNELAVVLNDAGYRTVAVEPRGMGRSISPVLPRATMHDFAKDVATVVGHLDEVAGGRVHVVGRAFGARVARAFATDYPHLTRTAVLLAGGGAVRPVKSRLWRYLLGNFRFVPQWLRGRVVGVTLYAAGNTPPRYLAYRHPIRAVRRQFAALRTPLDDIWKAGSVPMLWIHGQEDTLVPVEDALALSDRFPEQLKLVVIPRAGHALLPEQPGLVQDALLAFLRQYPLQTTLEAIS